MTHLLLLILIETGRRQGRCAFRFSISSRLYLGLQAFRWAFLSIFTINVLLLDIATISIWTSYCLPRLSSSLNVLPTKSTHAHRTSQCDDHERFGFVAGDGYLNSIDTCPRGDQNHEQTSSNRRNNGAASPEPPKAQTPTRVTPRGGHTPPSSFPLTHQCHPDSEISTHTHAHSDLNAHQD